MREVELSLSLRMISERKDVIAFHCEGVTDLRVLFAPLGFLEFGRVGARGHDSARLGRRALQGGGRGARIRVVVLPQPAHPKRYEVA